MDDELVNAFLFEIDKSGVYHFNSDSDDELKRALVIYLLDDLKVIKKPFTNSDLLILSSFGKEVIDKGGWIEYKKWKAERDEIEFRKTKVDLDLAEKTLKEFPNTKRYARIGCVVAVLLALFEIVKMIID